MLDGDGDDGGDGLHGIHFKNKIDGCFEIR